MLYILIDFIIFEEEHTDYGVRHYAVLLIASLLLGPHVVLALCSRTFAAKERFNMILEMSVAVSLTDFQFHWSPFWRVQLGRDLFL
jgi:hypothetical protein